MTSLYLRELFNIALEIANYPIPHIKALPLLDKHKERANQLISCGALTKTHFLKTVLRRYNQSFVHRKVICDGDKYYYIAPEIGPQAVDKDEITVYALSLDWPLKNILYGLGISTNHKYITLLDQFIWNLGHLKIKHLSIPVIVVRHLQDDEVYEFLAKYLELQHSMIPALIIALDYRLQKHLKLSSPNVLMMIQDIMLHDESEELSFNIPLILEKMDRNVRQEGYSDGYRSAYFKGIDYTFTKKRAEVVEYLFNADGRKVHQDEIMAAISPNSKNNKLFYLFRLKNGMHPAWGTLIQNDGKGNYWLNTKSK